MKNYYKKYKPNILYDKGNEDEAKENIQNLDKELKKIIHNDNKPVIKIKHEKSDAKPINTKVLFKQLI